LWDDFLRFLAPFWEAFGRQNIKKGSQKSDKKVDAIFGISSGGSGGMRGASGGLFLGIFWQFSDKVQTRSPPAFGRGRRI
jgi:hypothetical protein